MNIILIDEDKTVIGGISKIKNTPRKLSNAYYSLIDAIMTHYDKDDKHIIADSDDFLGKILDCKELQTITVLVEATPRKIYFKEIVEF